MSGLASSDGPHQTGRSRSLRVCTELRTWQREALDAWSRHGRYGVIEAVTGTGKWRVGIEALREALCRLAVA